MTVTLYQSTDAGAPSLTGQANALNTLLTACLVNGYGAKAAAGWSNPYNGGNVSVFKGGGGNQTCLRCDDSGGGTGGTREARMLGYETMTAVSSGTQPFPTPAQVSTAGLTAGLIVRKSASQDGTVRSWRLIADNTRFYFFCYSGDNADGRYSPFFFGDITSYKTGGDAFSAAIVGRGTENTGSEGYDALSSVGTNLSQAVMAGHFIDRSHTGIGSSQQFAGVHDGSKTAATWVGSSGYMAYPNAVDGGLYQSRIWVAYNSIMRGHLPGVWSPMHATPLNDGDTFSGAGTLSGRTFMAINLGNVAQIFVETSSTWD